MNPNSRHVPHIPSLDLSVLDRPETKDHLISLLRSLAEAQAELCSSLPEDPIQQLVAVSQLGMEHMRLNKSGLTIRSEISSSRGRDPEKEVKKLKREVRQQRRAMANYEFFLRQPEVSDTVNKALGRINTLKCVYCHKFFTSQHYLDQHVVRRHPELAGLGAERLKTSAATDRRHAVLKHCRTESLSAGFLTQLEALQKVILSVNSQKAQAVQALQDVPGRKVSDKLREVMSLQQDLNKLLEQQQRLLADQIAHFKELQDYSPPISRSESQQTSFFDKASVGEAALESWRSEQSRKWELDGTSKLGDVQEEWRNEAPTRRRLEQGMDLAKIELSFKEAKGGKIVDLGEAKKKAELLRRTQGEFAFCPVKYGTALRSFYPHTEEDVISCRKQLIGEVAKQRIKPIAEEYMPLRAALAREADQLRALRCGLLRRETVQTGLEFCEGAVVRTVMPTYVGMSELKRNARSERQRESLLSLDYENSVSFSIRWGDEEEESGEWRGINADEARRLGFFYH